MPQFSIPNENILEIIQDTRIRSIDERKQRIERVLRYYGQQAANMQDDDGDTPLLMLTGDYCEHIGDAQSSVLIQLLLSYGANPLQRSNEGTPEHPINPLILAANSGRVLSLKELLNHIQDQYNNYTNWYEIDDCFRDLLTSAEAGMHSNVISALLEEYQFDPNLEDSDNKLLLPQLLESEIAILRYDPGVNDLQLDTDGAVRALLKHDADPNLRQSYNNKSAYDVISGYPIVEQWFNQLINEYQPNRELRP